MWTAHGEGKFYSKAESLLTEAAHQNLCPIRYPSSTPRVPSITEYPWSTLRVPPPPHVESGTGKHARSPWALAHAQVRARAREQVRGRGWARDRGIPAGTTRTARRSYSTHRPSLPFPSLPFPSLPFLRHLVRSAQLRCAFGESRGALMRAGHRRALLSRWQAPRAYATSRALHPPLAVGPPLARAALGSDPSIAVGKNVPERPCVLFRQPLVDGGTKLRLCTTIILYFTLRAQRTCGCYPRCPVYYA